MQASSCRQHQSLTLFPAPLWKMGGWDWKLQAYWLWLNLSGDWPSFRSLPSISHFTRAKALLSTQEMTKVPGTRDRDQHIFSIILQDTLSMFELVYLGFCYWVVWVPYIFLPLSRMSSLSDIWFASIFSICFLIFEFWEFSVHLR